ncbi:hypothetical protein AGMMS49521_0590 [Campylobacterota bacterium]|nr:hypothetical protein AGMMS49521_0590 [Campylobacterota bacterium]
MNYPQDDSLLLVAKVGRTVALKGACKLHLFGDFPDFFSAGRKLIAKRGDTQTELTIASYDRDRGLALFQGFATKELAATLTNYELFTTADETKEAIELSSGEHFWFEIIGIDAYENETRIGKVETIDEGSTAMLTIALDESFAKKQSRLVIPYSDRFVEGVTNSRLMLTHTLELIDAL